jgi:hypothetical protein
MELVTTMNKLVWYNHFHLACASDHRGTQRKDAVPQEEGMASRYDEGGVPYITLYGGLDQRLHFLTLFDFRGGKAELELLKAIMESTHALWTVNLAYSARRGLALVTAETHAALERFVVLSNNHSLRNRPVAVIDQHTGDLDYGAHGWCGTCLC